MAVVLLHGLGRTRRSMARAAAHLREAGFDARPIGYPSRRLPIETLARHVAARLPRDGAGPLHFLTHSMGGIVLRQLLRVERPPDLGRVVMLAPPNHGSGLARRLGRNPLFRLALGPAGTQLTDGPDGLPARLGPADYELGVIVGNRPFFLMRLLSRGEGDGKVTLDEARLEGMRDFRVVPCGHTFIMNDRRALDQAVAFLRSGRFRP